MGRFILIILFCLFCLGVVWMRTEISRSGREIGQLQREVEIKEARNQYLKLEILRLSGPEQITARAQEELGIVPLPPHHVVVLGKK